MNIHSYYKPKTVSHGTGKIVSGYAPTFESKYNKLYSTEKSKKVNQFTPTQPRLSYTSSITAWPYKNNDWEDPHYYCKPFKSPTSTTSGNIIR